MSDDILRLRTFAEVKAAWAEFKAQHIVPSRLFRLARKLETETAADRQHIERCKTCRDAYWIYATDD